MRFLLLLFSLFLLGNEAQAQVDYTWLNCNTLKVCVSSEGSLFTSNSSVEEDELLGRVILRSFNGGIVSQRNNVDGCVTFSNLQLEWRYEIEVQTPTRIPVSCSPVYHAFFNDFIGCRGQLVSSFATVETGPATPSIRLYNNNTGQNTFNSMDVCGIDAPNLSVKMYAFGETNYRIDMKSRSLNSGNENYITLGWQNSTLDDAGRELLVEDEIWSVQHSGWYLWPNNEYTVILAVSHTNCTAWNTDEVKFTVLSGPGQSCRVLLSDDSGIDAYPNPFTNEISLKNLDPSSQFIHSYEIIGIDGRQHMSGNMLFANHSINTSNLPKGAYVIRVTSNGELITTKQVIKQ